MWQLHLIGKKYLAYLQDFDTEDGEKIYRKWKCKCGNFRTRRNGRTNLMEHIKTAHPSYLKQEVHCAFFLK